MNQSAYHLITRENRELHTQRHTWHPKAATTLAAVVLGSIWSSPAQAYSAGGYFEWSTFFQHCCGHHPVSPAEGSSGAVDVNQAHYYKGEGHGTWFEVYGGTQASRNSVSLALGASGYAWEPLYARLHAAAFVANSDLITVNSNSLAAGAPIDVRLHLYATHPSSADIPVTGSILGYDFELSQSQPTFYRQVVVPGFLTIGGSRSVGALINKVAAGKVSLSHGESYSAETSAMAFFAIEILTPGATIPNHDFNALERDRLEGLDSTRPSAPAEEDVTNDGRRQIIGVDRDVIGGARHYHTTEPNAGAQRLQLRSASPSADAGPTGYEYQILAGPSFMSILLPEVGDGLYDVSMWGDSGWEDVGTDLSANTIIDLTKHGKAVGTRGIRVTGIEAGSIPAGTGFVSGLTFSETGHVQWTQTSVPVPEPGTWALWLAGLAGLSLGVRRRVPASRVEIDTI